MKSDWRPRDNFDFAIGIDQTGAYDLKKGCKPLKVALLKAIKKDKKPSQFSNTKSKLASITDDRDFSFHLAQIPSLSLAHIDRLLELCEISKTKIESDQYTRGLILVDCVLGLPKSVYSSKSSSCLDLIPNTQSFSFEGRPYGAKTAFKFFSQWHSDINPPQRICEQLAKANSVFKLKPYQKNIGCGTFRIWKDLSTNLKDFYFPHLQTHKNSTAIPMMEAYPSLIWKTMIKSKSRDSAVLIDWVKKNGIKPMKKVDLLNLTDPDWADSLVMAIGGMGTRDPIFDSNSPFTIDPKEGWIYGLTSNSKVLAP